MAEHIPSAAPTSQPKNIHFEQFENALKEARRRLHTLRATYTDDTLQVKNQLRIIQGYERQIAAITGDWTHV